MSSLKSIGIDVGVIAKGLNYRVSLFNQRLTDTENQVSTLPFEPSDITDWESCGCGDIDTIPSALDKLAELRALTADRVTALEQGGGASGQDGADGASAYELAVGNGFSGTEAEWLESLIGADGADGTNGTNGVDGSDGDSAYQVAVNNGFTGTEAQWLASLQGADGADGVDGTNGTGGFTNWSEDSNGHIIPASNATYDIGSAEKKVRHFYLSDNSLQIGGEGDEIAFVANKEYFLGTATKKLNVYTSETLPDNANDGESVLVSDGNVSGDGVALSYFYDHAWYRTSDNAVIKSIPHWAPSDIHVDSTDNLIGWYDPTNTSLMTLDANDRVSLLLSSNGNYELTPNSVGPQVGTRKFNNLNVFDFDATCRLSNSSIPTQSFGFYAVFLFDADGVEETQEFIFDSLANTSNRVFLRRLTASNDVLNSQPGGSTTSQYPEDSLTAYVLSFESDQDADTTKLRINGADQISSTSNTATRTGTGLGIGANFNNGAHFDGFLGDIIITKDLANTEKIEGYLAHKWGLADSLIGSHTYKNTAP